MKFLLIINTNEPETVWSALRLGSTALGRAHDVSLFLLGSGVEIENIGAERFDVPERLSHFLELGGKVLSCGTCLHHRGLDEAAGCPISTMDELVGLTEDADRILTFG
jgi:sulfur relay (sulfurtransferase) complex TusBCD TusD component (DsrE family)